MCRKMFSSTTIASSMTIPTASVIASSVMLFSVKPITFISVNDEMIEAGIARAEMRTARILRMNTITMTAANRLPKSRCSSSDATDS